jgi:hypothetical protein
MGGLGESMLNGECLCRDTPTPTTPRNEFSLTTAGQSVGSYRVFSRSGAESDILPGLAMSRSLGDGRAHELGVIAQPTVKLYEVQQHDGFLVRARGA